MAQKSLSGLEERITNARDAIYPKSPLPVSTQNILLIDGAVGSGVTLNEIAKKLHPTNLSKKLLLVLRLSVVLKTLKLFEKFSTHGE